MENGPVEIVDFPIKKWWIFPWQNISSPEGTPHSRCFFLFPKPSTYICADKIILMDRPWPSHQWGSSRTFSGSVDNLIIRSIVMYIYIYIPLYPIKSIYSVSLLKTNPLSLHPSSIFILCIYIYNKKSYKIIVKQFYIHTIYIHIYTYIYIYI